MSELSLQELVNTHGGKAASEELRRLQAAAHEAHIAWSVTAGYFEQSQQASKFFPALRPVFRKEMNESAKVAKVRESFLTTIGGVRDEIACLLMEAMSASGADQLVLIQQAIDELGKLPLPGDAK